MADLSPELASRIQSLEASYADNPGRYFVALAGAWREAGDIARAEEILRENLKRFPGLSAHVLLGRCLADRGAFQEAANEFHYVLSIDSQNLIALRTLAEMAAVGGRRAEAERWYNELLAVDPMNVEARTALSQLARSPAAPAEPAWGDVAADASLATPGGAADEEDEFGMIDLGAPDASPADASGVAAADDVDLGEWGDLTLDVADEPPAAQPAAAAAEGDGGDFDAFGFGSVDLDAQPAEAAAPAPDWLDADARQDLGESAAADAGGLPLLDDGMIDAPLAGADLPLLDADDAPHDAGLASAVSEPGAGFGFGEPATGTFDHVTHEADGHDAEAEMVTETMAELYASQGLLAQAADVYRELIGQRGEEPGLARRLAEIEARMTPAAASAEPAAASAAEETPDWLASVDAFARGGEPSLPADTPAEAPEFAADHEPAADFSLAEPAPSAFAAVDAAPDFTPGPAAAASADPFADSFAHGFAGAAEAAPVTAGAGGDAGAEDGRQAWEAPSLAETEPVGFDILVVADEEGAEVPAPPEVVADVSADWAIAAAPLEDDEEAAEGELAGTASASPGYAPPAPGTRTVAGYFAGLLAWQPGQSAAAPATYDVSVDDGTLTIEPAAPEVPSAGPPFESATPATAQAEPPPLESAAPTASADEPLPLEAAGPQAPADEPLPFDAAPGDAPPFQAGPPPFPAAPDIPTFQAPAFQPPPAGEPVFGGLEPEAEAEPWAAPVEDEPWAGAAPGESAPGESAPEPSPAPAPDALPLLDLEEPWAETPAAPREPVDIGSFTLDEDAAPAQSQPGSGQPEPEEPLPWEVPAEPAAAAPEPAASDAGGFSFEDFFSGAPAAPAEPEPQTEPEPPAPPAEPAPAFVPSFAEPTPPPVFEPALAAPAPSAPAPTPPPPAAQGQDEDDEDLESFQAWLQSLKR